MVMSYKKISKQQKKTRDNFYNIFVAFFLYKKKYFLGWKELLICLNAEFPICTVNLFVAWSLKRLRNLIWDLQRQSWNKKAVAFIDAKRFLGSLHGKSELWDWQRKIPGLLLDTKNNST